MPSRVSQRFRTLLVLLLLLYAARTLPDSGLGAFSQSDGVILPAAATAARTLDSPEAAETSCACADASILNQRSGEQAAGCEPVCIGQRGYVVVRMAAAFKNASGPDLRVYELGHVHGGVDDSYNLYISQNGHEWLLVAENVSNQREASYAEFELRGFPETYWFVKIEPSLAASRSLIEGPEILAVEALNSAVEFDL